MSIIQIMVTIIIVTILVTVILGLASYGAYWLRRGRRPAEPRQLDTSPRFFVRYAPIDDELLKSLETEGAVTVPLTRRGPFTFARVGESGNGGNGSAAR